MAWTNTITEAAYIASNGKRMVFNYDPALKKSTPLKTAEHTFPDVDGAEIQPLGLGGKKFPVSAIFDGPDCMKDADTFEQLLSVRGYGILEHPIYGKHTVVPTGEIGRSDNLVSGLNESVVEVTFAETITDKEFPESEVSAIDALDAAAEAYEGSAVASFLELIETETVEAEIQLQTVLKNQTDVFFKGISQLADKVKNFQEKAAILQKIDEFKKNIKEWTSKIDQLKSNAENIANVMIKTAKLTAQTVMDADTKIRGYVNVVKNLLNNVKREAVGVIGIKNQYAPTNLMVGALTESLSQGVAKTAVVDTTNASSDRTSDGGFISRAAVLEVTDQIIQAFEVYKEYMDSQICKNAFVDTGEGYEALLEIVVDSVQVLQTVAFELPVTRIVKLGRDRQILEFLTEVYGAEGFDKMDQFITDNKLTADEIVVLPMGREVRYYA